MRRPARAKTTHSSASHGIGRVCGSGRSSRSQYASLVLWCVAAACVVAAACSDPAAPGADGAADAPSSDVAGTLPAADPENPSAAAEAKAHAEALAAQGWPAGVVADAEAIAAALAGLEAEGSSGEFEPVPPTPKVRVVAFGSLEGDGRSDPRPLAGVTIIAIPYSSWWAWWGAMIGGDFRDDPLPGNLDRRIGLPLGGQLHADAQQVLSGPGAVISTTGADGTADMWLEPGRGYQVCALPPDAEGLIAGCEYDFLPDTRHTDSKRGSQAAW